MKVLLVGYIGKKNFGDDLLFKIAIDRFKSLSAIEISTAIVENDNQSVYLKRYFDKLNILSYRDKIPLTLYSCFDIVFFIGGGVFFDYDQSVTNVRFIKKLASTYIRFRLPKIRGTKFIGMGIGVGPYFSERAKLIHAIVVKSFAHIGVRDQISFQLVEEMGNTPDSLTSDLSIGLQYGSDTEVRGQEVILCVRSYKHNRQFEKHIETMISFSYYLVGIGMQPHWLFLQKENNNVLDRIRKTKQKITIWNPSESSLDHFMSHFYSAYCVISSRMHSIFIAGMCRAPFIAIEVHQKLRYASELFTVDPVVLHPNSDLKLYINAFKKMRDFEFNDSKLDLAIHELEKSNEELNLIIKNIHKIS